MDLSYSECLTIARQELKLAHKALHAQITEYPTPISGCDAQFNHLLAERRRVRNALNALAAEHFVPTPRSPEPDTGIESR